MQVFVTCNFVSIWQNLSCINTKDFSFSVLFIADYDAPLTESGDVTEKFHKLQKVIKEHAPSTSG